MIDTRGYIHQDKTETIRVLGDIDVSELAARVASLSNDYWNEQNSQKPNRFGVFGSTQHVVLKFVKQLSCPVYYDELPAWQEWRGLVEPILEQVREYYGYEKAEYPRVMFARVLAGGEIGVHSDGGRFPSFCHKVHVPLLTNPEVGFFIAPEWHHLSVGTAVEVNNNAKHMVRNQGPTDRVHLVFEWFRSPLVLSEHQKLMELGNAPPLQAASE